jgi:hypothetical protein
MKKITLSIIALSASLFSMAQTITFKYTDSIKSYTIPSCVDSITIIAKGAQGGYTDYSTGISGGLGADITGTFAVSQGEVYQILAGGMGGLLTPGSGGDYLSAGGGGGSFVWRASDSALLIAAGGGGGGGSCSNSVGGPGQLPGGTGIGGTSYCGSSCDNGNGVGGGGAGWLGNGAPSGKSPCNVCTPAMRPLLGGTGGTACAVTLPYLGGAGGFGGGGAGDGNCGGGGGGGGYTGGNGAGNTLVGGCSATGAQGGTSFNNGTNQTNIAGKDSGNGEIIIILHGGGLNLAISDSGVTCCGASTGKATVAVSGGTPAYTYSWSPSGGTNATAVNLSAGTYTVNVTDSKGVSCNATAVITQPTCLVDSAYNVNSAECPGQCVSLNVFAFGGSPSYTYLWSTGATSTSISVCPTTNTTYTVNAVDMYGCTTTTSVKVNVLSPPTVTLTAAKDSACSAATKDSLAGSPAGGTYSGTGVSGTNFDPNTAGVGVHQVTYTYTDTTTGCSDSAHITIVVNSCAGINEVNALNDQIKFYPDPFTSSLNINVDMIGHVTVDLFNAMGENLGTWTLKQGANSINTSNLPAGVYSMRVKTEFGQLNKQLIKAQ